MRMRLIGVAAMAIVWLLDPSVVLACETCFGVNIDTPTTKGIAMAMLLLVGTTGVVGGGIGAFFYHVRRRSRMLEPSELVVTEYGEIHKKNNDKE